ncbi:MAG: hypothetical protein R3F02_18815 [Thiolinea sp.]
MDWTKDYIGKAWEPKKDCYYWFAKIQNEVFNRPVIFVGDRHNNTVDTFLDERQRWKSLKTDELPQDGDAITLCQADDDDLQLQHIGVYVQGHVIRAETEGVVTLKPLSKLEGEWVVHEVARYREGV